MGFFSKVKNVFKAPKKVTDFLIDPSNLIGGLGLPVPSDFGLPNDPRDLLGGNSMFDEPPAPEPLPAPIEPTATTTDLIQIQEEEAKRAARRRSGSASTIRTSPLGVTGGSVSRPGLLGQ